MAAEKIQKLGPNQRKWLKALESGKYKQATGLLHTANNKFCCLGIACVLFKPKSLKPRLVDFDESYSYDRNGDETATAPTFVQRALGLRDDCGLPKNGSESEKLTELNDNGMSFKKIAAFIKKNPGEYFKAPK